MAAGWVGDGVRPLSWKETHEERPRRRVQALRWLVSGLLDQCVGPREGLEGEAGQEGWRHVGGALNPPRRGSYFIWRKKAPTPTPVGLCSGQWPCLWARKWLGVGRQPGNTASHILSACGYSVVQSSGSPSLSRCTRVCTAAERILGPHAQSCTNQGEPGGKATELLLKVLSSHMQWRSPWPGPSGFFRARSRVPNALNADLERIAGNSWLSHDAQSKEMWACERDTFRSACFSSLVLTETCPLAGVGGVGVGAAKGSREEGFCLG